MIQKLSPRLILGAIAAFSFGLLAYAWMLQYGAERQQPCPLCVLQRYVYLLIGITALIGAAHQHIAHAITTATFAIIGAGLALWQVLPTRPNR
jgi:protein dithiol:quinone oxidoreductase